MPGPASLCIMCNVHMYNVLVGSVVQWGRKHRSIPNRMGRRTLNWFRIRSILHLFLSVDSEAHTLRLAAHLFVPSCEKRCKPTKRDDKGYNGKDRVVRRTRVVFCDSQCVWVGTGVWKARSVVRGAHWNVPQRRPWEAKTGFLLAAAHTPRFFRIRKTRRSGHVTFMYT